jgi:3-methyladenine DNA glycosylase AlkC
MPDKLKDFYDERRVREIGESIARVYPAFETERFVVESLDGLEQLELIPRAWHIAEALARQLPADYERAVEVLIDSLGPPLEQTEGNGMEPFFYMPHVCYVARWGLEHFEASMRAQHELTQRFSAEFSIRSFLERYPQQTLERLRLWTGDPSVHVRRLVSEGTRPRLPWAPRLRTFQQDPSPILPLLELLKDDPDLYVRRSVANNLNDIGKDHPGLLVAIGRRWLIDASPDRAWLVRHALRSLVKQGHPDALSLFGFGGAANVSVRSVELSAERVVIGDTLRFRCELTSQSAETQDLLVDFAVHFVKANGRTSPKVFKLRSVQLAPGATERLEGRVSFADMTTRRHFPGRHRIELLVNGRAIPLTEFDVVR